MPARAPQISTTDGAATLVWFQSDLRIADNPALDQAIAQGGPIIPVFLWAPDEESPWAPGEASRWWLRQSLNALAASLEKLGSRLIIRRGPCTEALLALAAESGARCVFTNRRHEPAIAARDLQVERDLREKGIAMELCPGNLLFEPGTILNQAGKPFQVFTAFWKHCLASSPPAHPIPAPSSIPSPEVWPRSIPLADLQLEPKIDWAGGLREAWTPGESGATQNFDAFLDHEIAEYSTGRDLPGRTGTSRLSAHLHFGEISARQIWHGVTRDGTLNRRADPVETNPFLRQIVWREFAHHLLHYFPSTPDDPLHREFRLFPWRMDPAALQAWTRGETGYPLVDAGMRQLWRTGWMHNRVRMLTASFLVKHLLIPWQEGARWFWDTLVDADLANNTLGWQWVAGCGADAAPYFRIFNPVLQGEKFDPDGAYVRRWVPELARVPNEWIHKPWKAPGLLLAEAGVQLGTNYPHPIVDHAAARARALEALTRMRSHAARVKPRSV